MSKNKKQRIFQFRVTRKQNLQNVTKQDLVRKHRKTYDYGCQMAS